MEYARTVAVLIAFGGWAALALGALRLQGLARERFRNEPSPALPRTYRDGVGELFRRVQQGRGTEMSEQTRAFAERTGRGAEYERARLFVRWGVAIMVMFGMMAAVLG